ncbi:MAG: hypothetical protein ACYTBZ_13720 [Planctomycetota bacterium]
MGKTQLGQPVDITPTSSPHYHRHGMGDLPRDDGYLKLLRVAVDTLARDVDGCRQPVSIRAKARVDRQVDNMLLAWFQIGHGLIELRNAPKQERDLRATHDFTLLVDECEPDLCFGLHAYEHPA